MSTHGSENTPDWDEPADGANAAAQHGYATDYRPDPDLDAAYDSEPGDYSDHHNQDWSAGVANIHPDDHPFEPGDNSYRRAAANGYYEEYDEYNGPRFRTNLDVTASRGTASGQFSETDFAEARPLENDRGFKKFAAKTIGILVLSLMAVKMIVSAMPELSKLDIVQMDGYGDTSVRKIYYSSQLSCTNGQDCAAAEQRNTDQPAVPASEPVVRVADEAEVESTRQLAEIPAVLVTSDAYESLTTAAGTTTSSVMPAQAQQQVVQLQWSNVRSEPNGDSAILRSLAIGTIVNVKDNSNGRWIEIETSDANPQKGYMHRSTISPLDNLQ